MLLLVLAPLSAPALEQPFVFRLDTSYPTEGPFGLQSSHVFDARIVEVVSPAGSFEVHLRFSDGRLGRWRQSGGEFTAQVARCGRLTTEGGRYRLDFRREETWRFDDALRLASITDTHLRTTTLTYDAAGRLERLRDARGQLWQLGYDARNHIVSVTGSFRSERRWSFQYQDDLLTAVDYPDGGRMLLDWDTTQPAAARVLQPPRLRSVTNRRQQVTRSYRFDGYGRVVGFSDMGRSGTREYHQNPSSVVEISSSPGYLNKATTWDQRGRKITEAFQLFGSGFGQRGWEYDSSDNVTVERDVRGFVTRFSHDAEGNTTGTRDAGGYLWRASYLSEGRLAAATDPLGNTWRFDYDATGQLSRAEGPLGAVWQVEHDSHRQATSVTTPLGQRLLVGYSAAGDPVEVRSQWPGSPERLWRLAYSTEGELLELVDPLGNSTEFGHDVLGRVTSMRLPPVPVDGPPGLQRPEYRVIRDFDGHVVSLEEPTGARTSVTYDPYGNVTGLVDPGGASASYTWPVDGASESIATDALGHRRRTVFDGLGQTREVHDALGIPRFHEYDQAGNLTGYEDTPGRIYSLAYDTLNRPVRLSGPDSATTTASYDATGQVTSVTDTLGQTVRLAYDAAGRLVSRTEPDGGVTRYERDVVGQLVGLVEAEGTPAARRTVMTRGEYGRITSLTKAAGTTRQTTWSFSYDALGQLAGLEQPGGGRWSWERDALGRVSVARDPLGRETRRGYDAASRLVWERNGAGEVVRHTWNVNGQPIETTYLDASGHQVDRILRSFDSVGNLRSLTATGVEVRFDYDAGNRLVAEHHRQANIVVAYERNAAGAVSAQTCPQLAEFRIERSYDAYDRLIALRSAAGEVLLSRDALGQVTSASLPNQVRYRASYDSRGRLVSHRYVGPDDTTFYFEQLEYDGLGRIVEVSDSAGTHAYSYDELDQLVLASYPWGQERFEYDAAGNPTKAGARTASFDAAGQSVGGTEPLTWDGAGRLLGAEDGSWRLSWNPVGQLVGYADGPPAAGLTQRHRYLPPELGGLHVEQAGDGVSSWCRRTLWSQDNPLLDLSAEGTVTTTYLAGDGLDEVYAIQRPNSKGRPRTLTLLRDHLGSVVGTVGGDGPSALVRYGAYGQAWPPAQEPSAVSTRVTLAAGLSGLVLPCQPRTAGRAWTVGELGSALGASVLVWTRTGADGKGQFAHSVAGLPGATEVVRAGQAYWVGVAGTGRSLPVSGPGPLESQVTAELHAGLNLVSVPARAAATHTSAELLALTGSGFVATPVSGAGRTRLDVLLPGSPPQPLWPDRVYLVSVPSARRVNWERFALEGAELQLGYTGRTSLPMKRPFLQLRHRAYDPVSARFLSQDPIEFEAVGPATDASSISRMGRDFPFPGNQDALARSSILAAGTAASRMGHGAVGLLSILHRYSYCNNNPLGLTDPTGLDPIFNPRLVETAPMEQLLGWLRQTGAHIQQRLDLMRTLRDPREIQTTRLLINELITRYEGLQYALNNRFGVPQATAIPVAMRCLLNRLAAPPVPGIPPLPFFWLPIFDQLLPGHPVDG